MNVTEDNLRVDLLDVNFVDGLKVLSDFPLVHPGET